MNTRSSSRKKREDLSYASTSRKSSEDYSSYYDVEDCTLVEDEDNTSDDDVSILEKKLERLKGTYYEKKLENTVLSRCMEVKNVSTFINDLLFNKKSKGSTSEEQKRVIKELYEKNKDLCKKIKNVEKLNKTTQKEILTLYENVQDLMEERKKIWDEAVTIHKLNIGDASVFLLNLNESSQINESNLKQKEKESLIKRFDYAVFMRSYRITRLARIFYNLISNSEVDWSRDKNLLEILDCTSKLLDKDFDLKYLAKFSKILDEVTHRLNKIKI